MINYFKNKKITLMGLGLLGRGVGDAQFLAECGADLIITDLKTKDELRESINKLKKYQKIKYTLGKHKLEDFRNQDMILKSAGVPLDSIYIKEARKNNISIKMSASLLAELSGATIIGVSGTRGKSTVAHLVYEILKNIQNNVYLAGNIRGIANLPLLNKVRKNDIIVMELDSWQLQGFGKAKISPHIAVFTNFLDDHLNYYNQNRQAYFCDKANIFKYQKEDDYLITSKQTLKIINKRYLGKIKSKVILASKEDTPKNWKINLLGGHNIQNIAFAIKVAQIFKIKPKKTIESFQSIPGRLEYLKTIKGIKIYNDNNATSPEATIAALKAFKNIVLIMGGSDKGLGMSNLVKEIEKKCKAVVLFKGSGTEKIKDKIFKIKDLIVYEEEALESCLKKAIKIASKGDVILYSPAFASFGKFFKNEFDRDYKFRQVVSNIKS